MYIDITILLGAALIILLIILMIFHHRLNVQAREIETIKKVMYDSLDVISQLAQVQRTSSISMKEFLYKLHEEAKKFSEEHPEAVKVIETK